MCVLQIKKHHILLYYCSSFSSFTIHNPTQLIQPKMYTAKLLLLIVSFLTVVLVSFVKANRLCTELFLNDMNVVSEILHSRLTLQIFFITVFISSQMSCCVFFLMNNSNRDAPHFEMGIEGECVWWVEVLHSSAWHENTNPLPLPLVVSLSLSLCVCVC